MVPVLAQLALGPQDYQVTMVSHVSREVLSVVPVPVGSLERPDVRLAPLTTHGCPDRIVSLDLGILEAGDRLVDSFPLGSYLKGLVE